MTTIGMHYDVVSGKEQEFEQGFANVIKHLSAIPGHRESHLYQEIGVPGTYLILSQWDSKQAYEQFLRSDAFKQVTAWGKAEILRGRPKHKVFGEKSE